MKTIFFGPGTGIWKCLFWDMTDVANGIAEEYCDFYKKVNNRFEEILISNKVIKRLPHFFRKLIYKYILKYNFFDLPKDTEMLFAFTNGYEMCADVEKFLLFLDFLKKEFINTKYIIHFYESLQIKNSPYAEKYSEFVNRFNMILTFNRYDEKQFRIEYYGPICEKGHIIPAGGGEQSDVFYAGGHKYDREKLVLDVFKYLSDKNKKCIFYISGLSDEVMMEIANNLKSEILEDKSEKYILYKNSKLYFRYISYAYALKYIQNTTALLDVCIPVGLVSCTARLAQAVNYEKKLITNCPTTVNEPYYHPENILVFEKTEDIDISFFEKPYLPTNQDFSASKMIQYIKKRLCE